MVILNNPLDMVEEAFQNLYPECRYKAYIDLDLKDDDGKEVFGITVFPSDSSEPTILISADLRLRDSIEILAHELAHVAAGVEAKHSERWEIAFQKIFDEYNRIGNERFGGEGENNAGLGNQTQ